MVISQSKISKEETEEIAVANSSPLAALAFKVATDPFVWRLTFVRVYSGTLKSGSYIYNSTSGQKERVGRLLQMHANTREEISEITAGHIGAVVGLKNTKTGDTLCDVNKKFLVESMEFPEPVISVSVEPKTKADQEKMGKVAYRETIKSAAADVEHKYSKQTGGRGQYGHVVITFEPYKELEEDDKEAEKPSNKFVSKISGWVIPKEYIPGVQKGLKEAYGRGYLAGYPMVDIKATLTFGSFHEVDSSELAFKIAASKAFQDACKKAGPILLEPVMKVEVNTPEEYMGDVIGQINSKRGRIEEMGDRGQSKIIQCYVPLSEMFGYSTELRSASQGRATYAMEFDHYNEVPTNVALKIREERGFKLPEDD